jgi:ankyrin repeat protein
MTQIDLPNEILFMIAEHLPNHASISALMRTDCRRYHLLREYLYDQISGNEKNNILNWAAKKGLENTVREMIRRGGDFLLDTPLHLDSTSSKPRTRQWLCVAVDNAAENGHAKIVRLLLERQPSALNSRSGYNDSPLRKAAANGHSETVQVLLKHSANIPPSAMNDLGFGPPSSFDFSRALNEALRQGQEEIVQILLADTRVSLNNQSLPAAAGSGSETLVDLCLREAPPWLPKMGYESPLGAAARRGHEAVFKMILNSEGVDPDMEDISYRTPLSLAAEFGQQNIMRILLETPGVELDRKDGSGMTPLYHAAARGHIALVEELLETGAVDVDSHCAFDSTPLWSAARHGHEKVVSMLIAAGANPDHRTQDDGTPLGIASFFGAAKVVKVLLATGRVKPASYDRYGRSPLIEAARGGRFLGKPDNFVRTRKYEQKTAKIIVPMLRREKNVTPILKDRLLETDVMQDTSTRDALSVMKQLLAIKEVDPNAQDSDGRTALSHAAEMHEVDAVRLLLEDKRVNVNLADHDGWIPMNWLLRKLASRP